MVTTSFSPLPTSTIKCCAVPTWCWNYYQLGRQRHAGWCVGTAAGPPVICRFIIMASSMVQVTGKYSAHFYYIHIDKHTGKHLTGDRVRILWLTLLFLLRDLIVSEVTGKLHCMLYIMIYMTSPGLILIHVDFINNRIRTAFPGSPLHGIALVKDPSDELIEVHLATLKWNLQQLRMGLVAEDCVNCRESQ